MKPRLIFSNRRKQLIGKSLFFAGMTWVCSHPAMAGAPTPANWVDLTFGGYAIEGDSNDAAFQRRLQNNGDFYGGIDSFHFEQGLGKGTFTADGHALFGADDYEVDLKYTKDDMGYIRGGYREFRTWYDGSGGYLPGASTPDGWIDPITEYDDDLHVDRGEVFFEAGLTMENLPTIIFGYTHRWRYGQKDSSIWGIEDAEDAYGLIGGGERGVAPTLSDLDEISDIFTLDVTHTLGNTDLGMALRYQKDDNDNERVVLDGEIIQHDTYGADLFSGILTSETRFGEKLMMNFGYLYTTMDTDTDGSFRESVPHGGGAATKNFIWGGANFQQHVINGSLWWNPIEDLVIVPSVRFEWEDTDAESGYGLAYGTPSSVYSSTADILNTNQEIEVRYSGIENILLYANAEWMQGDEDLFIDQGNATTLLHERDGDIDTDFQKYTVGANWYPVSGLSVSSQYYYSQLDQNLDYSYPLINGLTTGNPTLDGILAGHAVETHDFNLRVTWRAMNNLSFTTRYDYKQSDIENESYYNSAANLATPPVTSGEITSHIISETATWNVSENFYMQGSLHWISSETNTGANDGANDLDENYVIDWDNDYMCASLNAGYSFSKNTDVLFGYFYSESDNYLDNSSVTVPYGTASQEHAFTVTLIQRINANMTGTIRYGWFRGDDDAVGGYNDYDAHMVSTGLQVRF
jgi:hypothetical protein